MNLKSWKTCWRGASLLLVMALLSSAALPVSAAPGDFTLVSVDSNGTPGNSYSARPSISPDGRYVVFESMATNWDLPGTGGLYVRDLQLGQTSRLVPDGEEPVISSGGRFVAFTGFTSVGGTSDTDLYEVFMHDRQTGVTTKVSVDSSGVAGNGWSDGPAISDDGRYITFNSEAINLVPSDTNGVTDIFLHDMQSGVTERISIASDGTQANSGSSDASISADGRYVAFSSSATNLVAGDTNAKSDIFVRDRQTGTTTRVSVNSSGVEADRGAYDASISGNGRFVSFTSTANNLQSQDPMGFEYVYVHDRQAGTTTLASIFSDGSRMYGTSEQSVISADGRYVAFQYDDRGDSMPIFVIYAHDMVTGITATVVGRGASGDDWSALPTISADGRFVAFVSGEVLVSADTNGATDVYLKEMAYAVPDVTAPIVTSITRIQADPTNLANVDFALTFSEPVTGVDVSDFALTLGGPISGSSITGITGSGQNYIVSVNTGTGDGTLRLDLIDNDSIKDAALNALEGIGRNDGTFTEGEVYTIDKAIPAVVSILRADPSPTAAATVHFVVTFSELVTGVDGSDFTLTPTGNITGFGLVSWTQVGGQGVNYEVTINTGSGDGTLRLGIGEDDTIVDATGNPLGGPGIGNGNFEGETYTINKNAPVAVSNVRQDPNPTSADVVHFTVIFSEPVTGVDSTDFLVTAYGISGTSIQQVYGDGISFWIAVATGTGNGELRLDVVDNDSILDLVGLPLGGTGLGNGNFTTGESYTISRSVPPPPNLVTETFRSNGTNDGWVLESAENSNVGGTIDAKAKTFNLGDDFQDRQFRAILHFPTQYLPDNAVVTRVILMIKSQTVVGSDPFTTHQSVQVDIHKGLLGPNGFFGLFSLQPGDFQAAANRDAVGLIANNPVGGWYWSTLDATAFPYVNLTGATQIRLRFQLDDNDDMSDDYIKFFSGNAESQGDRPQLSVEYYVP
ncbi:MAG: hypothetical protein AB1649_24525 [Chloroflexota bacterium]